MKTKYGVILVQIFSFLFLTPVYAQWERRVDFQESRRDAQIQKDSKALLLTSTSLDSFITATMSSYHIPGLSACILKEGELVWHKAYGYADIARGIRMTDSTLFWIASISKTITGTALMQLYERGLFQLDDNVNTYLPSDLQIVNPSYPNSPIAFKMILSHVSSINDNWTIIDSMFVAGDSPIPLFDFLKNYLVPGGAYYTNTSYGAYPPASTFNYCNVATGLLAYLVEAFTDTAFEDYCQKHIFSPLSMNETSWFLANLDTSHIARPHEWTSSGYKPLPHRGHPLYPCGQLRTSSLQLARFLNMFMQKGTLENTKILDSSTVALMTTIHYPQIPVEPGYPDSSQGLIWYQEYFWNRLVWGHSGGPYGVTTAMYYYMPEKSGVIVLANGSSDRAPYPWGGVKKIISALFDHAITIPTEIAERDENILGIFSLRQNYPNPFNPSTTIEFALPKSSFVTLKIYNLLGEEVATLVSEKLPTGKHQRVWEAKGLASGVYLYRIEAGEFKQTQKLILLR
jgi:CubicO group peptidase (beta-lactamase class C family)